MVSSSRGNGDSLFPYEESRGTTGACFPAFANPCCVAGGRMSIILSVFYQTGQAWNIFCKNVWSTCAKPCLWMLAQKLDSIRSPFSNQFSKVDILQNSKKKKKTEKLLAWKGFHNEAGDIRMNARPLANEGVSIYNLNWWDWKQINPSWHMWTSVTCLPQL